MSTMILWPLIAIQIAMGGFDTFYHHEFTERLAWRPSQRRELMLHGIRNGLYAVLFAAFGFVELHGAWALLAIALLLIELFITLMDFVEEDISRTLPATERVTHTLLAVNYGVILALLVPVLLIWSRQESTIVPATYGLYGWLAGLAAFGTATCALRDVLASRRCARLARNPAAQIAPALAGCRTILVTGATGFVGQRLCEVLSVYGHHVIALVRDPRKARIRPPFTLITDLDQIADSDEVDAVVNLAGEPISNGFWTKAKRDRIVRSRVEMTANVVRLLARLDRPPEVLINGSAIGWYGLRGDESLNELGDSRPCFSHDICAAWEQAALRAEHLGVRVVRLRIGLVLGIEGGMLSRLLTPFEWGVGGPIGSGMQWMSWIERDDLVRLIVHAIARREISGPLNATAPHPVRNADFALALGRAIHRPALLRMPAAPLHMALGDFADELLLGGQRVVPEKALASGFAFHHPDVDGALAAIVGKPASRRPCSQKLFFESTTYHMK
jgi:hypothetical protein